MNELINDGLGLMVLGMGFVFSFLVVLIYATGLMSKLISQYLPEPVPVAVKQSATPSSSQEKYVGVDPTLAAAITAAIHQHRNR